MLDAMAGEPGCVIMEVDADANANANNRLTAWVVGWEGKVFWACGDVRETVKRQGGGGSVSTYPR